MSCIISGGGLFESRGELELPKQYEMRMMQAIYFDG